MAQISSEMFDSIPQEGGSVGRNRINFFSLKNDGEEAIVRFEVDSATDFDIHSIHQYTIGTNRFSKVNCLRSNPQEPLDKCPMCEAGIPLKYQLYIKLIEYTKDENGQVVATPKVWERSASYCNTLKSLITEYGPLSRCIFKVKRNGAPGDMKTRYDIFFANPQIYRPDLYRDDKSLFEGYSVEGSCILDFDKNTLLEVMKTHELPRRKDDRAGVVPRNSYTQQAFNDIPRETAPTRPVIDANPQYSPRGEGDITSFGGGNVYGVPAHVNTTSAPAGQVPIAEPAGQIPAASTTMRPRRIY